MLDLTPNSDPAAVATAMVTYNPGIGLLRTQLAALPRESLQRC